MAGPGVGRFRELEDFRIEFGYCFSGGEDDDGNDDPLKVVEPPFAFAVAAEAAAAFPLRVVVILLSPCRVASSAREKRALRTPSEK